MKILSNLFKAKKQGLEAFINEQRTAKRYELPLKLNYNNPATNCRGESLTKNISKTGLRFSVNTDLPKGTVLDVRIEDPWGNKILSSKAKIIWTKQFVIGDDAEDVFYEAGAKLLEAKLY